MKRRVVSKGWHINCEKGFTRKPKILPSLQILTIKPDARIITAIVVIQVVDKGALFSVSKGDPYNTNSARHYRTLFFHHHPCTPFRESVVDHLVSKSKIYTLDLFLVHDMLISKNQCPQYRTFVLTVNFFKVLVKIFSAE